MNMKNLVGVVVSAILIVALLPVFADISTTLPDSTPSIVTMLIDTVIPIILVLSVVMGVVNKAGF